MLTPFPLNVECHSNYPGLRSRTKIFSPVSVTLISHDSPGLETATLLQKRPVKYLRDKLANTYILGLTLRT